MRPHDIAPKEALCRSRSATDQNFEDFSARAAVLRFGMPCRYVKDCRVGRTRPPRNDKIGRICGKTGRLVNSKVWNFPQGDISIVILLGRYTMRPTGRISYAQHISYSHELYSITASAVLRFGMPCRCVKDCRVGRTRPPRNDKIGRLCGETGRSANSKVWNFSQGDISIVILLGRYIMRPTGRISYAKHISYSHELYSITASAVLRFGMPSRCVKDCRVGRTRPPRNDKNGRFCGETGRSVNSKVWNFPQGDTASALLRKRHFTRTQVAFHMRSIFHLLKEQISLRGAKKPGTVSVPGFFA